MDVVAVVNLTQFLNHFVGDFFHAVDVHLLYLPHDAAGTGSQASHHYSALILPFICGQKSA